MIDYQQQTYGQEVAELYDLLHPGVLTTDAAVRTLAELVGADPVLELGVGTGRLAIPLAQLGIPVTGVDVAPAMLHRLASKPGGDLVLTLLGDFGDLDHVDGLPPEFPLVFVAADSFFMLTSQEEQIRAFEGVARRLPVGGRFVIEAFVPGRGASTNGGVAVRMVTADSVVLGMSTHDPHRQLITGQQILIDASGIQLAPGVLRYAPPAELDLMARLAGLVLASRWGSWRQEPFTGECLRHVSVYTKH